MVICNFCFRATEATPDESGRSVYVCNDCVNSASDEINKSKTREKSNRKDK